MTGLAQPRMSYADLEDYLAQDSDETEARRYLTVVTEYKILPTTIARRCGVDRQSVYRWRVDGIPLYSADKIACNLGTHGSVIWGHDFYKEAFA